MLEDRLTPTGDPLIDLTSPGRAIQSVNGVLTATFTEQVATSTTPVAIGDSSVINAWTYNGLFVGPTLMANPGDVLDITIVNNLPEGQTTNLHTHGLHVSPLGNSDNVLLEIEPGEDNHYNIRIPADHPQGMYWYHPHLHGVVFDQISMGLSGLLIIGRPDGGATQLNGAVQHVLTLKNALVLADQVFIPEGGQTSQTFTVNGQLLPQLDIPAGRADVFNIANIGNNAFYSLAIVQQTAAASGTTPATYSNPLSINTFAVDGNPLAKVGGGLGAMPPGRRMSFSFTPSPTATGADNAYYLVSTGLFDGFNTWPGSAASPLLLMRINFTDPAAPSTLPARGTSLTYASPPFQNYEDLRLVPEAEIAARRQVVFGVDGDFQLINGQAFSNNPLFQPRVDTVEEWTLVNPTTNMHPFHLHMNPHQVVFVDNPNGPGQPTGLPQYQDITNVPPLAVVRIRVRFTDFLGDFVFHCHRVEHEDAGMMSHVSVIPTNPYYATAANQGSRPRVNVFNSAGGALVSSFFAYSPRFLGGVNVSVGDVNGDGVYDIITGVRTNGAPHVKVIDGTKLDQVDPATGMIRNSALLGSFYAFSPRFRGGVSVAVGDISADGKGDIVVSAGPGGPPLVKVVNANSLQDVVPNGRIRANALVTEFNAYAARFSGGVNVATGDINGDGRIDIVTGKSTGQALVRVFSNNHCDTAGNMDCNQAITGMSMGVIGSFLAYDAAFRGGVNVATGNIKGFAFDDIITGKGIGGMPLVKVFSNNCCGSSSAATGHTSHGDHAELEMSRVDAFLAYDRSYRGGVRVTSLHDTSTITPYGGSRDSIVTTHDIGASMDVSTFSRTIEPPPVS